MCIKKNFTFYRKLAAGKISRWENYLPLEGGEIQRIF